MALTNPELYLALAVSRDIRKQGLKLGQAPELDWAIPWKAAPVEIQRLTYNVAWFDGGSPREDLEH